MSTRSEDISKWLFAVCAVALPLLLWIVHHDRGHAGDQRFFFDWFHAVRDSASFYATGPGVNYPIGGVAVVALPSMWAEVLRGEALTFDTYRAVLKGTLVCAEIGLGFALARAASALGICRSRGFAVATLLLPGMWAAGAWFGQIDVVGTVLLLGSFASLARFAFGQARSWDLSLGLLAMHAAILMKQLALFSISGLLVLVVLGIRRCVDRRSALILVGLSPLVWFVADPWLDLPEGYSSHLAFVLLGGGSAHGEILSGGGANVWSLLSMNPGASAHDWRWLGISAFHWGWLLFGTVVVFFLHALLARLRAGTVRGFDVARFIGATNLAMAVCLTGVHERYMAHGIPFLLLGVTSRSRRVQVLSWTVAVWSGMYILASLSFDAWNGVLSPLRSHVTLAVLQIALLATLIVDAVLDLRRVRELLAPPSQPTLAP